MSHEHADGTIHDRIARGEQSPDVTDIEIAGLKDDLARLKTALLNMQNAAIDLAQQLRCKDSALEVLKAELARRDTRISDLETELARALGTIQRGSR